MPSGIVHHYLESIYHLSDVWFILCLIFEISLFPLNIQYRPWSDSALSDLGLPCLPRSHLWAARHEGLIWRLSFQTIMFIIMIYETSVALW